MTENENNNQINNTETNQTEKNNIEQPQIQINTTETSKQQNNKKSLVIIISAIIALIIVIVLIIIIIKPGSLFQNSTSSDDKQPTMTEEEKQEYMEQLNSTEGMNLSQVLYNYATDIYSNKKYEDLAQDENGVYYATKYDLMLMNYDVSLIDEACTEETPIIYFDIDHKMNDSYEFEPIVYNVFCEN